MHKKIEEMVYVIINLIQLYYLTTLIQTHHPRLLSHPFIGFLYFYLMSITLEK